MADDLEAQQPDAVEDQLEEDGGMYDPGEKDVSLEAVYEVPVEITVVLGRTSMPISNLLKMNEGTVVELERKVGEAVEVFVNERLVARGEVVIVEDKIGITLTEVIKAEKG